MILAIDIGNSNIVIGAFKNQKLTTKWRLISDVKKSIDDYAVDIIELFLSDKLNPKELSGAIIGSVVPKLETTIKLALEKFFTGKILIANYENVNTQINLENKNEVGIDRLLNAKSAFKKFGGDLIIVDFGTATTFDIIDENGAYIGGIIAPGINLSLKALSDMTAKLPKITIEKQEKVIGKNTVEAMNSGVYFGYIALIEGLIVRIEKEIGHAMIKITTGGLAPLFEEKLGIKHYESDLTLDGLYLVYSEHVKNIT